MQEQSNTRSEEKHDFETSEFAGTQLQTSHVIDRIRQLVLFGHTCQPLAPHQSRVVVLWAQCDRLLQHT